MSYYSETLYTIQFQKAYDMDNTLLTSSIVLDSQEHTNKLIEALLAKYWLWELASDNMDMMKEMFKQYNNRYKDYYSEQLKWYETAIDFLDGVVTKTKVDDNNAKTDDGNSDSKFIPGVKTIALDYDLPRSNSSENRPSKRTTTEYEPDSNNTSSESWSSKQNVAHTVNTLIKGGKSVVELKDSYRKLILNIYQEFASKFEPCFLRLWS